MMKILLRISTPFMETVDQLPALTADSATLTEDIVQSNTELHLCLTQIELVEKLVHSRAKKHKDARLQRCITLKKVATQKALNELRIAEIDEKLRMAGTALIRHLIDLNLNNFRFDQSNESDTQAFVLDPVKILPPELGILFQGPEKNHLAYRLVCMMNTTYVHELQTSWYKSKFIFKVIICQLNIVIVIFIENWKKLYMYIYI
jgi:hypothetical protein